MGYTGSYKDIVYPGPDREPRVLKYRIAFLDEPPLTPHCRPPPAPHAFPSVAHLYLHVLEWQLETRTLAPH